jgi:hypothetical protein
MENPVVEPVVEQETTASFEEAPLVESVPEEKEIVEGEKND